MNQSEEKDVLIKRLKYLLITHDMKQAKYQNENGLDPEVACFTKESLVIASLLPKMLQLGVTLDDCRR